MFKVFCCTVVALLFITFVKARIDSKECEISPPRHCMIEYEVRDRWPHQERYWYHWNERKCIKMRWSDHCDKIPDPPNVNNFPSEDECLNQCSGWA
ncbi:hypothetical protein evm_007543 [Chilo suppressalis]|nr:hypothetical protein evm_007543 [Chilo suppressalis]